MGDSGKLSVGRVSFEDDNRVTTRLKRWLMAVYPVRVLDWAAHFKMARELERGLRG